MCGIIGYVGGREATSVLMDGLKRLEYRGYDSAGVSVLAAGGLPVTTKCAGKVEDLTARLRTAMPAGHLGIGHTRWATHGRPITVNAHPHIDCSGRIAVVHNGIIENFAELRSELQNAGHAFVSETDSEVVPHLIEHMGGDDFVAAVRLALKRLSGAYALAMFSAGSDQLLLGARLNAPLIVGVGDGEYMLASDITAVLSYTRKVLILDDGQIVAISPRGLTLTTPDGDPVEPNFVEAEWDASQVEKGGFTHFMRKEIEETAYVVRLAQAGGSNHSQDTGLVGLDRAAREKLRACRTVRLLGMGTSLHAGMVGEQVIERWAGVSARAEDASEFRYREPTAEPDTVTVAITQSGETADTIGALRQAAQLGSYTLALTNVVASTAAREADAALYVHAGPEIGVCATKTFVSQLISLYRLALELAAMRGKMDEEAQRNLLHELSTLPELVGRVIESEHRIASLARRYSEYQNFLYVGRGLNYPVALEGALKLKEISYRHAEGTSGGALKHGPIAMLDSSFPVIAVCTEGRSTGKTVINVHEVVARNAPVLALVNEGDHSLDRLATDVLEIPRAGEPVSVVLASIALQLFAYHVAVTLGRDVDQPRNLAKSVTVE
jgi:glucosamine--fructose-6-phosphate aminotransferase (isomerizing)